MARPKKEVDLIGENTPEVVDTPEVIKVETPKIEKANAFKVVLKNTTGKDVKESDYFFSKSGNGKALSSFHRSCGYPVEREELLSVFDKIFDPKDNFLFYRTADKEVYIIIVPLKYSSSVSGENESSEGDFQKHAISFINEGSVNVETLKFKLKRIVPFVRYSDR